MYKDSVIILTPLVDSFIHELHFDRPADLLNINGQSFLERIIFSIENKQVYIVTSYEQTYYSKIFKNIPDVSFLNTNKTNCDKIEQLLFAFENVHFNIGTVTILESNAIFSSTALNVFFQDDCEKKYIRNQHMIGPVSFPSSDVYHIYTRIKGSRYISFQDMALDIVTSQYKLFDYDTEDFFTIYTKEDYFRALNTGFKKTRKTYNRENISLLLPPMKKFVGVYDVIGAQLSELMGFDGLWLGSYQLSLALGIPDDETYNPTVAIKLCDHIKQSSVTLPIIIDIGNGFSNERDLIIFAEYCNNHKNIVAICVDDNDSVRDNSMFNSSRRKIISTDAFKHRIHNLKKHFRDDLMFIARTEMIVVEQEGIDLSMISEKCKQLLNGCADIFLPHYVCNNMHFFEKIFKSFDSDCSLLSIPTGLINLKSSFFESIGINILVYANVDMRNRIYNLSNIYSRICSNHNMTELLSLPTATNIKHLIDSI